MYKLKFLVKTLSTSKSDLSVKAHILFSGLNHLIDQTLPYLDHKLSSDLEFCNSSIIYDLMRNKNYDLSKIILVGNPIFDKYFQKRSNKKTKTNQKIQVLLAPTSFHQRIDTEKELQKNTLHSISKKLCENKNRFDFFVKLHPTTSLDFFKKHIHSIDNSIRIYQKGDASNYVELSDVILVFTIFSSVFLYPLIFHKPIIICNFSKLPIPSDLEQIVFVCTDPDDLPKIILDAYENNHKKHENIELFLKSICYDLSGTSSQKISNSIVSLLKQRKTK